jgi:hypothetical protein
MTKPRMIVAALVALGGSAMGAALLAQGPGEAGRPAKEGPTGKALIETRLETAREAYQIHMKLWQNARAELTDLPLWSRRWMDAEIRLAAGPAAKVAAIEAHLERLRPVEALAKTRLEAGRGTNLDILDARYHRLEAEEMLADARANPGARTPAPAPK